MAMGWLLDRVATSTPVKGHRPRYPRPEPPGVHNTRNYPANRLWQEGKNARRVVFYTLHWVERADWSEPG